ncbi:helix-turn-helix domain-containing protein [Mycobacterium sp. TY814]|uniref:winged helix-turn-helix transcriptional regulator n=1 Tax=unclassified Mycobacterium TaxID=2642494 RepID=UPI0027406BAD|nr:helix-turn-helix domain-containing protein [Mycobacterium sp. TY814]MDP7722753.1 helix-turn-helix domain-containing protein [Mycobacterium sp. TY814]
MDFEKRLRDRTKWSIGEGCPMAKTLDLLSTKTTFLVLRECFYGTTRFEDFVDRIGASAPAVSRAVKQLEAAGIIERAPYQEPGHRVRDEYRLTPAGKDLLPVLLALAQWGDKHLHGGRGPLRFVNATSGRPLEVRVTDESGCAAEDPDEIQIRANPAFRRR